MRKELDKKYDPGQVEDRIYDFWLSGGYFHAEPDPDKKPYTIVIPPPNITGQLHMGHALDETFQDILIRYKRMQGYEALWLPGTDHASIATEAKIVEAMRQEGLTKEDLGREGFLERAWEWKEKFGSRIIEQLKKLGSSCDWERERFTLDEGCSKAVREVFCRLYEKGLIYQGERIINWCPHCKTSISDAEVEYEEQAGHFWHIRYPFADGSGYMEIATTRPETMLGDTALAVHPEDERYRDCVGKSVILPLVDKEIPVVADEYVDREFGTGVVKITPAHDPNDFEVGARHDLPIINVMTEDGHMAECAGRYAGMDRYEARKAIVADLEAGGYLVRIEDHTHNVGTCYRCGTTVEPMVSKQWFVKMEELAAPAIKAVREGETQFVPARFDKTYYNWMENIRDWCISRQLWWGHRIPAYYCDGCGETIVAREEPACCPHCGGKLRQDEDTLDTWFSSALWPFSTLGWPDKTPELDYFFPTDTLVTGYDIIFFWVARMIFSSIEQMGEVPFKTVFIHGLVRDAQGRKMSKSLGNGIDPLEVIAQYGADALRLTLATGNSPGNDMRFSDDKIMASRNFCNKIWNAARFILMNLGDEELEPGLPSELEIEDKWVLSKYNEIVRQVTQNIDKFELGIALGKVNEFVWDIVCDWYIEIVKLRLQAGGEQKKNALRVLCTLFEGTMKLLHPFAPFITEEIWQALPHQGESIMTAPWPVYDPALSFAREEEQFEIIMKAIRAIRNRRSELQVPPSKKAKVFIETERVEVFSQGEEFIKRLASASEVAVAPQLELEGMVMAITAEAKIGMPMDDLVDREKERQRLEKEKLGCEKEIASLTGKLQNEKFVSRAPQNVVDAEREKLARAQERLKKVEESLAAL
ncbi:valine--tRNA ligase [Bittarella massiliensis (ex Durand et al. 2017)]|uniref:valine--tRNA ligase n=1 Tax=Bittarella massiliensis (ex Durand et al. 2017) TaxID=1720313 RepID=UPI00073F27F1|nr:valine--tRNA ligase [Bittarella massiliensis (ex Durand et al. 2017)]